jgi:hypothetical protein
MSIFNSGEGVSGAVWSHLEGTDPASDDVSPE